MLDASGTIGGRRMTADHRLSADQRRNNRALRILWYRPIAADRPWMMTYSIENKLGPVARELLDAWSRLPKQDHVPFRASFDPMSVPRVLPVIILFERSEQGWRFRLVGTEIDRRWGRTVTGLDYAQLVSAEGFRAARREFEGIAQTPCGSFSVAHVAFSSGRRVTLEILRLPLRARDGSVSLILCSAAELSERKAHGPDLAQEIGNFEQRQFFDIGAGLSCERW